MEKKKVYLNNRRAGKGYAMYNHYIRQVRNGEKAMVMGIDYVVLSMNLYKTLLKKAKDNLKSN